MAKTIMNLLIIIFIIVALHDLSSTSIGVNASCRDQCLRLYRFYSQFYMSQQRLENFKSICLSKCPINAVQTTPIRTPKPTTRSPRIYWWQVTQAPRPVTPQRTTRPGTSRPYWRWWNVTPHPKPVILQRVSTEPTTQAPLQAVCGVRPAVIRIVGGVPAYECEFPWVVHVRSIYICGGTILDHRHILTAAHCFKQRDGSTASLSSMKVKVGSSNFDRLVSHRVQAIHIHPKFRQGVNDYDVAILTLSEDLQYGACTAPVCLPDVGQDARYTDGCWSAGWGVARFQSRQIQKNLQKVLLPIIPLDTCKLAYGPLYVNELKICAGDFNRGGRDSCTGDSGGPLMCKKNGVWVQHGIVSFGKGCAAPRQPGVYTRLTHKAIRDFITQSVSDIYG